MGEILKRSQVPVSDTWNTKDLFHTPQDWEEAYAQVDAKIAQLSAYQGKLGEPTALKETLHLLTDTEVLLSRVYSYAQRNLDVDSANSEFQALSRAQSLSVRYAEKSAFIQPELLEQRARNTSPPCGTIRLSDYRMMFDNLMQPRAHAFRRNGAARGR